MFSTSFHFETRVSRVLCPLVMWVPAFGGLLTDRISENANWSEADGTGRGCFAAMLGTHPQGQPQGVLAPGSWQLGGSSNNSRATRAVNSMDILQAARDQSQAWRHGRGTPMWLCLAVQSWASGGATWVLCSAAGGSCCLGREARPARYLPAQAMLAQP